MGADLSPEGVRAANRAASEAARSRRETHEQIRAGGLEFPVLLMMAMVDPAIARIKVVRAVCSFSRWGPTSAQALLRQLRIPVEARLSYLMGDGKDELVERLADSVALGPRGRPEVPEAWPFFGRSERAEQAAG